MKKNIAYIVTSGEYSDFSIDGAFSTQELAEQFAEQKRKLSSSVNIEEWPLDEYENHVARTQYRAAILLKTGEVTNEWDFDTLAPKGKRSEPAAVWDKEEGKENATGISYVSAAHARKLAVEARQKWLRNRGTSA